jgi:peptidoglycan/xylan/chitin deacetylase (PgdA/CDA1 family)
MKYRLAAPIMRAIPFSLVSRVGRGNLIIFYYHLVSDGAVPHVSHLYQFKNVKRFIADLEFIERYYSSVELVDVIRWSKGITDIPPNSYLLTFDDGFREIYDVIAPILSEKRISATFFISSAFLDNQELGYEHKASLLTDIAIHKGVPPTAEREISEILTRGGVSFSDLYEGILKVDYHRKRLLDDVAEVLQVDFREYLHEKQPYLTSVQVRELLDAGFAVGGHSVDHPCYATLSLAEQLEQTFESVSRIRETFGLSYGVFAFPHHDRGVSQEFFNSVGQSGLIDMTFGTGGIRDKGLLTHRQRVSLENPSSPARELISWQYGRKAFWEFKERATAWFSGLRE